MKKKRFICLFLAAFMLLSLLSGCDSSSVSNLIDDIGIDIDGLSPDEFEAQNLDHNVELIIIAGKHDNTRFPTYEDLAAKETIMDLMERCYHYHFNKRTNHYEIEARVRVIVADGYPIQSKLMDAEGQELALKTSKNNSISADQDMADKVNQVLEAICSDTLMADDDDVDLAAALQEAVNIFNNNAYEGKERHILIIDSGICTTGYLNMQTLDIQNGSADNVVRGISPGGRPNLNGITINFMNLGNFAGGQMIMKSDQEFQNQLTNFWAAYLNECGATVKPIYFSDVIGRELSDLNGNCPHVNEVIFRRSPGSFNLRPADASYDPEKDRDLIYNEETIGFEPNKYTFKDEAQALAVAQNIKTFYDQMKSSYPDVKLYVVGSIAGINNENSSTSYKRALSVIEKLEEAGIPSDALIPINGGTTVLPWRNTTEYTDADQAQNRVVAVIPSYRTAIVDTLRTELGDRFPY